MGRGGARPAGAARRRDRARRRLWQRPRDPDAAGAPAAGPGDRGRRRALDGRAGAGQRSASGRRREPGRPHRPRARRGGRRRVLQRRLPLGARPRRAVRAPARRAAPRRAARGPVRRRGQRRALPRRGRRRSAREEPSPHTWPAGRAPGTSPAPEETERATGRGRLRGRRGVARADPVVPEFTDRVPAHGLPRPPRRAPARGPARALRGRGGRALRPARRARLRAAEHRRAPSRRPSVSLFPGRGDSPPGVGQTFLSSRRLLNAATAFLAVRARIVLPRSPSPRPQPRRGLRPTRPPSTPACRPSPHGGQCTANFIFTGGGNTYIGQAAHCAGTGAATDTNGCDAGTLPLGTPVEINGASSPARSPTAPGSRCSRAARPTPTPARTTTSRSCRIDPADVDKVNPSVPGFGGPASASAGPRPPAPTCYSYGNSSLRLGIT